ncbi:MAG: type II toxin-antitoxin system VapC family toxin [Spirochaetaceae bacterium]|jgi:PIN domain nuclease of toxin-antitoxin system|nr:type II toxin-antitoxin system VapC family toxin [Spirochaetaceae bacterium]
MNILLDTHALIWAVKEPKKLSTKSLQTIQSRNNNIYVSVLSFWEISLKIGTGKMALEDFDIDSLPLGCVARGYTVVDINPYIAASFHKLPLKEGHKDPFDRMLIWQAINKGWTLISKDSCFEQYKENGLKILW